MSTMFCTMAGSGAAAGLVTVDTLFSTAVAAVVPVVQSVRILMTCLVIRKLHLGSLLYDQRGNTAFVTVACRQQTRQLSGLMVFMRAQRSLHDCTTRLQ